MANTMSAYGSNTNRPLSEIVGLSTDTKPTDSIEGIKIQNGSSFRELDTGKKFLFDAENITWNEVSSGGGGGGSTLIEKSISANGVYNASSDSADGYSKVTVDVPNTYTAQDEGKVVDNGALVAQTAMSSEVTENGTVDTTLYNSVTVNVPSGGGGDNQLSINSHCRPMGNKTKKILAYWGYKTWYGLTNFQGNCIWSDGNNIYYSNGNKQYVLDKSTSTWSTKAWNGLANFYGDCIWSDGDNIYYSNGADQYVLDKATSTWSTKAWSGLSSFRGEYIWTDGNNIYYSRSTDQYVLDKSTSTWSTKSWTGLTSFHGTSVWTDGDNIYISPNGQNTAILLNNSLSSTINWSGLSQFDGNYVWSDGDNIYLSDGVLQYVLLVRNNTLKYPECKI